MEKSKSEILKQRGKEKPKNIFILFLKWFLIFILCSGLISVAGVFLLYNYITQDLPEINPLKDYQPPTVTTIFSDDGRKIGEFFKEKRIVVDLEEMPKILIKAFIAAEDSRFWEHSGIDLSSIFRAALKNFHLQSTLRCGHKSIQ